MLFTDYMFFGLLLVTFAFFYIPIFRKKQTLILILSSLFFYAYEAPWFTFLLLASASINILISYFVNSSSSLSIRKRISAVGVILNISLLVFFKYSQLLSSTFFDPNSSIGHFLLFIPLPIGISFFTFEGISLVVDVWRDTKRGHKSDLIDPSLKVHAQKTLFFISFFPHLIAGPILKAHEFYPQIKQKFFKDIEWSVAFKNLIVGYFLKSVIADNLKNFTFWLVYPYFEHLSTTDLLIMLFGYSIQIFADFAGYSLIAIGLAKLFGYKFPLNFNFPYISSSFKEFWKRWHISLSTFLMQYLYIPLGGNRKGKLRTYLNLMLTMFIGGLWHGAAWSYAVWGIFHGGMLVIERLISNNVKIRLPEAFAPVKIIFIFILITFSWLLFKLPEFNHVILYFKSIYGNQDLANNLLTNLYILLYSLPVVFYHILYLLKEKRIFQFLIKYEFIAYGILLFFIITNSGSSGSFIYFQF